MHRKKLIKIFAVCALCGLLLLVSGCGEKSDITTGKLGLIEDKEFGSVHADISNEELMACGFELGDSVDVIFENGNTFEDVPIYDGYYNRTGEILVCCYPTYETVCIACNNIAGMLYLAETTLDDTVEIKLREAGKYKDVQDAMGMKYSSDREDYESDVAFANFREFCCGDMVKEEFYRGATPFDSVSNRPQYVQSLLKKNGIRYILDLADTEEKYAAHLEKTKGTEYTDALMNEGNVALVGLTSAYMMHEYCTKLTAALAEMTEHEGPYYVHCTEGKDRTGFVCVLLESLAGATYDEMEADYMKTYENYYGITPKSDPDRYDTVVNLRFVEMMGFLHGTEDMDKLKAADFSEDAREYLEWGGMSDEQVDRLVDVLTKN